MADQSSTTRRTSSSTEVSACSSSPRRSAEVSWSISRCISDSRVAGSWSGAVTSSRLPSASRRTPTTGCSTRCRPRPRRWISALIEETRNGMSSLTISTTVWRGGPPLVGDARVEHPHLRFVRRPAGGEAPQRQGGPHQVLLGGRQHVVEGDGGEQAAHQQLCALRLVGGQRLAHRPHHLVDLGALLQLGLGLGLGRRHVDATWGSCLPVPVGLRASPGPGWRVGMLRGRDSRAGRSRCTSRWSDRSSEARCKASARHRARLTQNGRLGEVFERRSERAKQTPAVRPHRRGERNSRTSSGSYCTVSEYDPVALPSPSTRTK